VVDCNEVLDELGNYLDDDMAAELRAALERHLAQCSTCRVIVDTTRRTVRIVTESRSFDLPDDISERIIDRILKRIPGGSGGKPPSGSTT
jgi:anti-sigma factor (TIGR02949 family)